MWAPIFIQHAQSVQRFCKPGSPKWSNFGARSAKWPKQFIKSSLGHPASVIPRKPQWMLTKIAILQIKSTAKSWEHDSIVEICLYLSALFVCPWTGSTLEKRVGCWQFCEIFSGSPEAPQNLAGPKMTREAAKRLPPTEVCPSASGSRGCLKASRWP